MTLLLALFLAISDPGLEAKAQVHAEKMADSGSIFHSGMGYAENVGRGPSLDGVIQGFWQSASHRRNMQADWTHTGMGVVRRGELFYVVILFENRSPPAPSKPKVIKPPMLVPPVIRLPLCYWMGIA